jgi:hypothetical protein
MRLEDRFENRLDAEWHVTEVGYALVTAEADGLRMKVKPTPGTLYSNAQIADYAFERGKKPHFRWRPPLRMTVTAWAQAPNEGLRGTAGFGFWNHPFSPDVKRLPRLPQAIWFFFSSPPSNMQLAQGVPGPGWKAATIDTTRGWYLAPLALPAVLMMRSPRLYNRLWLPIQKRLKISERIQDTSLLTSRHTYGIAWRADGAVFSVDGEIVFETPFAPRGAAGFIAWLDNQYAIVTPQGQFGFGVVPVEHEQTLALEHVAIESM